VRRPSLSRIPLPPLAIQREYITEFEQERAIKTANQNLIALMEKKIATTRAELWEDGANRTFAIRP
jgi:hypothetical protein